MKKKMNNKGFSLVELIIVIAIMALLVAVLAPQYLKHVENSRKSTDCQNADAIVSALAIYVADTTVSGTPLTTGATVTITRTNTAVSATNATGNANLALAAAGISSLQLKSADWQDSTGTALTSVTITATVGVDGTVTFASNAVGLLEGTY